MKLLTHNLLRCNLKGVKKGYPLRIEATQVEVKETEFNPEFVQNMLERLDWDCLRAAAAQLGKKESVLLPEQPAHAEDESFLKLLHHLLVEVVVVEGYLVCPESGRKFKIDHGIPNMLLNEDEV